MRVVSSVNVRMAFAAEVIRGAAAKISVKPIAVIAVAKRKKRMVRIAAVSCAVSSFTPCLQLPISLLWQSSVKK